MIFDKAVKEAVGSILDGFEILKDHRGVITERYTFDRPILREAFFEGYGLPNDAVTEEKMKILSVKMALADIYNGYSHNHPHFLECGKRMLSHLMEDQLERKGTLYYDQGIFM